MSVIVQQVLHQQQLASGIGCAEFPEKVQFCG